MSLRVIARRFALALSDTVDEASLVSTEGELATLAEALNSIHELREYLAGPLVPMERKKVALRSVLESMGASKRITDFLLLLVNRHRVGLLPLISEEFSEVVRDRLGIVDAEVTSAAPLDQDMQERTRASLAKMAHRQVRAQFRVDPSLLGGVRARIGSTIYDGSVRGRLDRLRDQMTKG